MISVVIPVKNDNNRLMSCLSSLTDFDDVVVVESAENAAARELCSEHCVRFEVFSWDGLHPKKRNWVLNNIELKYDWVLFLDSDEVIPCGFKNLLCEKILRSDCDAFYLYYNNLFKGKYLNFGVPQRKIALFKRNFRFEKVTISSCEKFDMEVHEHPVITGNIGRIRQRLLHNEYQSADRFITKHVEYAKWEAAQIISRNTRSNNNLRMKVKYTFIHSRLFPLMYFILNYFVLLGFLDGRHGFDYAKKKMWYFSLVRELVFENN